MGQDPQEGGWIMTQQVTLKAIDLKNAALITQRLERIIGSSASTVSSTRYALARVARMIEAQEEGDDG